MKVHREIYRRDVDVNDDSQEKELGQVPKGNEQHGEGVCDGPDHGVAHNDRELSGTFEQKQRHHAGIQIRYKGDNRQRKVDQFVDAATYFATNTVHECRRLISGKMTAAGVDVDNIFDNAL